MVERLSRAMRLPRALHGSASLALPFRVDLKNLGVFAPWREIPLRASWRGDYFRVTAVPTPRLTI